jgi:hypothetical protein
VWHAAKWLFNRLYWQTVPQGRIPEWATLGPTEAGPEVTKPDDTEPDDTEPDDMEPDDMEPDDTRRSAR